jgi:arginyl-tRNA synthetase
MIAQKSYVDVVGSAIFSACQALHVELCLEQILEILEKPKIREHGDIAFPCFAIARQLRQSPAVVAKRLEEEVTAKLVSPIAIAAVVAAGPFLNFKIAVPFLATQILPGILGGGALDARPSRGERVMVEYSQPNTHKAFHVGHVRCAALGDSLSRLMSWQGYDVIPVNYLGDEGTHVARCIWYFKKVYKGDVPSRNLGEFLGEMYVRATDALDISSLSRVGLMGVTAARIVNCETHPKRSEWFVVDLETNLGVKRVVTNSRNALQGATVAWAKPGTKIGGRSIGVADRDGIESEGMLCGEKELALGSNAELLILAPETTIGVELADIYANKPGSNPVALIRAREREVSEVLQAIESQKGEFYQIWQTTKEWSMVEFKENYAWLDCRFDHYFFESECGELGKTLVNEFLANGVFEKSEGAVGAHLQDEGLGFCILIKRDGTATYACRDLALAKIKFEQYQVDRSLYVVDERQKLHFQQVFACLKKLGYPQAEKSHHFDYSLVVGKDGKMSSRKGNVVLFSQLKALLGERIESEFLAQYRGTWPDAEVDRALHVLSLATIRYGMLKQDPSSQIVFDLEDWSSRSGNTGPYLLYAYARISSLLKEVNSLDESTELFKSLHHESERDLILHLGEYGIVVERTGNLCATHLLAGYLFELSKLFNAFYRDCSVHNAESGQLKTERFLLVKAVGRVLKGGLELLGIPVLERM